MDIVERLQKVFGVVVKADDCFEEDYSVAREAANEIKRLRQQVAELEKQNAQTIKVNEFLNHKLSEAIKELNKLDVVLKQQGDE